MKKYSLIVISLLVIFNNYAGKEDFRKLCECCLCSNSFYSKEEKEKIASEVLTKFAQEGKAQEIFEHIDIKDERSYKLIQSIQSLNVSSKDGYCVILLDRGGFRTDYFDCKYLIPLESLKNSSYGFVENKSVIKILQNYYYPSVRQCLNYLSGEITIDELFHSASIIEESCYRSSIGVCSIHEIYDQASKLGLTDLTTYIEKNIGMLDSKHIRGLFYGDKCFLANKAFEQLVDQDPKKALRITVGRVEWVTSYDKKNWGCDVSEVQIGYVNKLNQDLRKRWDALVAMMMVNDPQCIMSLISSIQCCNEYLTCYDIETDLRCWNDWVKFNHFKQSSSEFFSNRFEQIEEELKKLKEYENSDSPLLEWFNKQKKQSNITVLKKMLNNDESNCCCIIM